MRIIVVLLVFSGIFFSGFFIGKSQKSEVLDLGFGKIKRTITKPLAQVAGLNDRQLVLMENPGLINRIMEGGSFGNDNFSAEVAQNMFSKNEDAIEDAIDKTTIQQINKNVWFIQFPIVNCVLIETTAGLVLIDAGMKPVGPALLKAIRSISNKNIHTIIYTHGHVDHSYGTWALIEDGESPQIIAHKNIKDRFYRYLKLRGSIAKYMSQPIDQLPSDSTDIVWPTKYISGDLSLKIGDINFELKHFEAETDDQIFVWMPDQKILVAADYYQDFLPNAGNGKRVQRDVEGWIAALKTMVDLSPETLLPMHGDYLKNATQIQRNLLIHIEALEYIVEHTIKGLNKGLRKDQVFQHIELPAELKDNPLLKEEYVTAKDISKMVIKQYTGWWDDIPSHWSPEKLEVQAQTIVELAGGLDNLLQFTKQTSQTNLAMASHLIDWAWLAEPENPEVQNLLMEIYKRRILSDESVTQEMLVYLDHMAAVRSQMK